MHKSRKVNLHTRSGIKTISAVSLVSLSLVGANVAYAEGEAGEAGASEAKVEPWPESRSEKSFDALLGKVFEGEAGEAGWGVNNMTDGTVVFPILNGTEVAKLFGGNSLVREGQFGFYFAPDGRVEGFLNEEKALAGTWKVEGDQVCIDVNSQQIKIGCANIALVVDRVIFFRPTGPAHFTGFIQQGSFKP